MMNMIDEQINRALQEVDMNLPVDMEVMEQGLSSILERSGMPPEDTTVKTVDPTKAAVSGLGKLFIPIAVGCATVAVSVPLAITFLFTDLEVKGVDYNDELTNKEVAIEVSIAGNEEETTVEIAGGGTVKPLTSEGKGKYVGEVSKNGEYTIIAKNGDGETDKYEFLVDFIDKNGPTLTKYEATSDEVKLYFAEDKAGIDMNSVYCTSFSGSQAKPNKVSESERMVVFNKEYDSSKKYIVYVSDKLGNESRFEVSTSEGSLPN